MFKIGDKAKGFKFDSHTDSVYYDNEMDDYVDMVGEVVEVYSHSFVIMYPDHLEWMYPASLWNHAKMEEEISIFKVGDKVKYKKSSIDTGMIDATEEDVFTILYVEKCHVMLKELGSWWSVNHFEHLKEEIMQEPVVENQAIDWEVGQEVFCLLRGKGVIANTSHGGTYPVEVEFEEDFEYYTRDGKYFDYHKNRSLFFSEPKIEAEKFPPKKTFTPVFYKGDTLVAKKKDGQNTTVFYVEEETDISVKSSCYSYAKDLWNFYKISEKVEF